MTKYIPGNGEIRPRSGLRVRYFKKRAISKPMIRQRITALDFIYTITGRKRVLDAKPIPYREITRPPD